MPSSAESFLMQQPPQHVSHCRASPCGAHRKKNIKNGNSPVRGDVSVLGRGGSHCRAMGIKKRGVRGVRAGLGRVEAAWCIVRHTKGGWSVPACRRRHLDEPDDPTRWFPPARRRRRRRHTPPSPPLTPTTNGNLVATPGAPYRFHKTKT